MWYLKKSEPFGRLLLLKRLRIFFVIAQLFSLIKLQKKKNLLFISVCGACGVQVFSVGNTCAITCVQLVELCKAQPSSYPSGLSIRCQRQKTVKQSTNPQRPKERVYLFFVQFQASEWLASKKSVFRWNYVTLNIHSDVSLTSRLSGTAYRTVRRWQSLHFAVSASAFRTTICLFMPSGSPS